MSEVARLAVWMAACALSAVTCSAGRPELPQRDAGSHPAATAIDAGRAPTIDASLGARSTLRRIEYRPSSWIAGDGTRLRYGLVAAPEYEGAPGMTRLELEATDGSHRPPWRKDLGGEWTVLGHSSALHAYVLGGQFEVGAWLPLDDLRYLDERTREIRPSLWNNRRWMAFAAVPSPTLRYLALVAQFGERSGFRLYVLDLGSERLAEAGRAPAPPPTDFNCDEPRRFEWGAEADGLVEMDEGVLVFSPDERRLTARYGNDTCKARATKRKAVTWNLVRLRFGAPDHPSAMDGRK